LNQIGDVAQMVERSLCMREARGSIPRISMFFCLIHTGCNNDLKNKYSRINQHIQILFTVPLSK
jgi:hypothetical protein